MVAIGDIFSSSKGVAGAKREAAQRKKVLGDFQAETGTAIKGYRKRAEPAVTAGKTEAQKFYEENLPKQVSALTSAKEEAQGLLGGGTEKAAGYYTQGLAPLQEQYGQDQTGRAAYLDFLGLTPGGSERTLDRFNYSPMTMDLLKQQEQATLRNAASGGYLRSGAVPLELQKQAYLNLAPEWQNYGNRLAQFDPNAQGLASQLNAIGNVYNTGAANQAQVASSLGPQLAGTYSGYAGNQAGQVNTSTGQMLDVFGNVVNAKLGVAGTGLQYGTQNVTDLNRNIFGAQQAPIQNTLGLATALINAGGQAAGGHFG